MITIGLFTNIMIISHGYFVLFQCEILSLPHTLVENKISCNEYADSIPRYELPNTTMMQVSNLLICNLHVYQISSPLLHLVYSFDKYGDEVYKCIYLCEYIHIIEFI